MAEATTLELSRALFSARMVEQVAQRMVEQLTVRIIQSDGAVLMVAVEPVAAGTEAEPLFLEALLDALVERWEGYGFPDRLERTPHLVDMMLRLLESQDGARIILVVHPEVHALPEVLCAIAPIRSHARVLLESTNPVDRIVIRILPREGHSLELVYEVLQRLIGRVIHSSEVS